MRRALLKAIKMHNLAGLELDDRIWDTFLEMIERNTPEETGDIPDKMLMEMEALGLCQVAEFV